MNIKSASRVKKKVSARKKDFRNRKNISRICSEPHALKSQINLLKISKIIKLRQVGRSWRSTKKWKVENLQSWTETFLKILLHSSSIMQSDSLEKWTKGCFLPFPIMVILVSLKTLAAIAVKIYYARFFNRIQAEMRCPRGVIVKALDYKTVVSEFEF